VDLLTVARIRISTSSGNGKKRKPPTGGQNGVLFDPSQKASVSGTLQSGLHAGAATVPEERICSC